VNTHWYMYMFEQEDVDYFLLTRPDMPTPTEEFHYDIISGTMEAVREKFDRLDWEF